MSQDAYLLLFAMVLLVLSVLINPVKDYAYLVKNDEEQTNKRKRTISNNLQREAENQQTQRLNDLLNTLRASSEDATVTDSQFRSRFERLTENLNDDSLSLQEKPKRNYRLSDDGEIMEDYD